MSSVVVTVSSSSSIMKPLLLLLLVLMCSAFSVQAALGGDVSTYVDKEKWKCAKGENWDFMIVRSYHSFGAPDPNAVATLSAAKDAGISHRHIYHFPCFGVSAKKQIEDDVKAVGKDNFDMLWLDIETNPSPGCGYGTPEASCDFLTELINAAEQQEGLKGRVGVYSSVYEWGQTVGASCKAGKDLPVWYANYDGEQSFKDWTPFGGWSSPSYKQFGDNSGSSCGISADGDWHP